MTIFVTSNVGVNPYRADPAPLFTSGQVFQGTGGSEIVYARFLNGSPKHALLGLFYNPSTQIWEAAPALPETFESSVLQVGVSLAEVEPGYYAWVCVKGADETMRCLAEANSGWDAGYKAFTSDVEGVLKTAPFDNPPLGQVPISGIVQLEALVGAGPALVQLVYPQANYY